MVLPELICFAEAVLQKVEAKFVIVKDSDSFGPG
jgi:hypothetical protein